MAIKRALTVVLAGLVVLVGMSTGAQAQGGQRQSTMRDFLFDTLNGLVRQYQDGQESQAQSGMRDVLGSLAQGMMPQRPQQSWPGQQQPWPGQQQDINALFGSVVNEVARQYGGRNSRFGQDMNALFGDVLGDTFGQFAPNSDYYRNLADLSEWYQPPPPPPNRQPAWPQQTPQPGWQRPPQQQTIARCTILGEGILLTNTGAVLSQQRGGPVGQLVQPTNPRCRYMIRDYAGGEFCVATSGYVWTPWSQQPVGQCQ